MLGTLTIEVPTLSSRQTLEKMKIVCHTRFDNNLRKQEQNTIQGFKITKQDKAAIDKHILGTLTIKIPTLDGHWKKMKIVCHI